MVAVVNEDKPDALDLAGVPVDVAEWVRDTYYPEAWPVWLRSWRKDPTRFERLARIPECGT